MKYINKFHKSFKILWEYRLQNMEIFSKDMHQIILTLSICDYYLKYHRRINMSDYEFIVERIEPSQDFINKNKIIKKHLRVCLQLCEAFALMEKLHELGN